MASAAGMSAAPLQSCMRERDFRRRRRAEHDAFLPGRGISEPVPSGNPSRSFHGVCGMGEHEGQRSGNVGPMAPAVIMSAKRPRDPENGRHEQERFYTEAVNLPSRCKSASLKASRHSGKDETIMCMYGGKYGITITHATTTGH